MFCTLSSFACEVRDDTDALVSLEEAANRIISLGPNITEFVYAAGAGDRLIGVSAYSDYPIPATKLPIVADYQNIDVEMVLSLQPDLVIALKGASDENQVKMISSVGIPVYWLDVRRLTDIPKTLNNVGCLAGTEKQAGLTATRFDKRYADLKSRYQGLKPVSVFFEISANPLLTITHKNIIDDVISLCGGRNIFSYVNGVVPMVTPEEVIAKNPDAIVSSLPTKSWAEFWRKWPELSATKHGSFISVEPDWINRPGPRLLLGASQLCGRLASAR